MDYKILWDYSDALQKKGCDLSSQGDEGRAELYQTYSDIINISVNHMRGRTVPSRDDAYVYSRALCSLFAPSEIEKHMPEYRHGEVYRATSALASAMERAATGKSPRRLFGFL